MAVPAALRYSRLLNTFLSFAGIIISLYAVFVELKKEVDKEYTALCDINDIFACSKVFTSKWVQIH